MSGPEQIDAFESVQPDIGPEVGIHSLSRAAANGAGPLTTLPFSLKVLAENLLRHQGRGGVTGEAVRAIGRWPQGGTVETAFFPSRVIMPDASGIPLLADLVAMRRALADLGGDPTALNPRAPVDFIVDHSLIVEAAGSADALAVNSRIEFERNAERFAFIRWAQQAFRNIRVVPPGNGIMHQINIEYLAQVVSTKRHDDGALMAFPDTVLGMDSHTPMVNSLGVLGWGVGGIEAGGAMLGQPVNMLLPEVVGCRLHGRLRPGVTATDLVLTVTARLREHGVVQTFVEFCGDGLATLPVTDRATVANMAPEYGATMGFFPVDAQTLDYLSMTGRDRSQVSLVEAVTKAQGLYREPGAPEPRYSSLVDIDLDAVGTTLAGPSRPWQRTPLGALAGSVQAAVADARPSGDGGTEPQASEFSDGVLAIAAITSCTNTSNPAVLVGAGLLARNAVARGLTSAPWVKTSLTPGSRTVGDYLAAANLIVPLEALGFHVAGYGCATCMGASGDIDPALAKAVREQGVVAGAILSGNRNFDARVHNLCRMNYLASPPLVVAMAIAGRLDLNPEVEPLTTDADGNAVMLADLWPDPQEVAAVMAGAVRTEQYSTRYASVHDGDQRWQALPAGDGALYQWDPDSTYLREPPHFDGVEREPGPVGDITGAAVLISAADATTTDHISPVSLIDPDGAAGRYLLAAGVAPADFNNYMTRRANHEVMVRGTFDNLRFRNELVAGREGGWTRWPAGGEVTTVFDAAERYRASGVPLVVVAGKQYGTGSSRDWAAKGTYLLGVRAVLAESFERIHRSNLIGMGVLPLQFTDGATRHTLGLLDAVSLDITGLAAGLSPGQRVRCTVTDPDGTERTFELLSRLDTSVEVAYYRHGGMLHFALREALPPPGHESAKG